MFSLHDECYPLIEDALDKKKLRLWLVSTIWELTTTIVIGSCSVSIH